MKHFLLGLFLFLSSALTYAEDITLYTGFQKGTYVQIGEDLRQVCTPDLRIDPEVSQGTVSNLHKIITPPVIKTGYRFALIQKDAVDMMTYQLDKRPYKYVRTLFHEAVVIVVNNRSGIHSVADLNGRRVAGGQTGSGIWFTASAIQNLMNIKWLNIPRTPEESVLMVLTGEIDAMVVVGTHPMRLFSELPPGMDKYISILPLAQETNNMRYLFDGTATIGSETYSWVKNPAKTYTTSTQLIAAADVPDATVKELKSCITQNLTTLKKLGHPGWKSIK